MEVKEISVQALEERLKNKDSVELIDVREPHEVDICTIEGSTLIPMDDVLDEMSDYDKNKEYIIYCRSGKRSDFVCRQLMDNGFQNVVNLKGGILQWAMDIDPNMPTY